MPWQPVPLSWQRSASLPEDPLVEDFSEREKEAHGRWTTIAWIGSGIYLFATTDGARFLSWQAAAFFIVGMFVAAVVFGLAAYLLQRGVAKVLVRIVTAPSASFATTVRAIGVALFVVETVIVFFVARWIVQRII